MEMEISGIIFDITALFLKSVIRRWPAIILAANRIDKVIGRIKFLIVSMHTIKIISVDGVPWGTKCENMWFVLNNQPKIIIVIQAGKAKDKVIIIWLVDVKI